MLKESSDLFENFCRISLEDFEHFLNAVESYIRKKKTTSHSCERTFSVNIRFLATGDTFKSLHYLLKISLQIISKIVPELCSALVTVLNHLIKVGVFFLYPLL